MSVMTTSNTSSVLKDVVAYVDVWSSEKRANYSNIFIQQLEEIGAEVSQRFNKRVTHVVFHNGHPATWRKAKNDDIRLVSVLWVKSCYENGVHADEELFPALNDESNPVLKNRKHLCMLPKDYPVQTTENDWRLRKKLEKMKNDLPPKTPLVEDLSPVVIDEKNGIIYSPGLKRVEYMTQRLKEMKAQHENLSPTASQMSESSHSELKPSLGSTPTAFKFQLDNPSDDDDSSPSVAKHGCSLDKVVEKLDFDFRNDDHLEQDSMKPWLSPCHDVPKRISSVPDSPSIDIQEDQEGSKLITPRRASTRKKGAQKLKFGDNLESPIQDKPDKSKTFPKDKRQPPIKSASKSETKKKKTHADASFKEIKSFLSPNAVISSSCLSTSATLVDSANDISKDTCLSKTSELKTLRKARLSFSALVRSFTPSSEQKAVASSSADADDDVFEDYFSPANHKRSLLPDLPVESNIRIPFELDLVLKKRKQRQSESLSAYNKMQKMDKGSSGEKLNQQSDEISECLQKQDVKTSLSASNCESVCVELETKKQSPLEFTSSSKTTGDAGKWSSASTSGQPSSQTEATPDLEQQKLSGLSHTVESGENECLVAAAPTDAEENRSKPDNSSLQKMVNKKALTSDFQLVDQISECWQDKGTVVLFAAVAEVFGLMTACCTRAKVCGWAMRTLVMTSMPTEKQHTVVQVVKALGGFSVVDRVCESTTHVVSGGHRRTLNILLGIARGCWILSFEWILWCLEQRQWIPEEPYELSDPFPAAQICRLQRHLSAGEHQQDLFQNQPAMFVSQLSQPPTQSLAELIELCGGTVCRSVRQAGICIGKYSGRRPEGCRMLSEQWILDSITNLKLEPHDVYDLD